MRTALGMRKNITISAGEALDGGPSRLSLIGGEERSRLNYDKV